MSLIIEKPKAPIYWKPVVAVLVIAGILILWFQLAPKPSLPLSFEILGFEGDTRIYDLESRSWRAPKRGEDFKAGQLLKTGPDGMINFQVENEIQLKLKENSEIKGEELAVFGKKEVYKLRLARGVLLGATTRQFERKQKAGQVVLTILTRDASTSVHGAIFRVQAVDQTGLETQVGVLRGFVEVSKPLRFFASGGIRIRGLEQSHVVNGVIQPAKRVSPEEWELMKESYGLLEKTAVMEAEQIDLAKNAGTFFNYVFDHGSFFTPKIGFANREFFKDPDSGQVFLEAEYDVFPAGSFSGVYIKTRDFDISKYAGISMEIRRNPEEGAPDSFFIELKSKGNVVRRYAPRTFEKGWKRVDFDFRAQKPLLVNELVLVFTNARVGEAKKGVLEFRNMNLIPLPEPAPKIEAKAPVSQPAVSQPAASSEPSQASAPAPEKTSPVPQEVPLL